jgi:hypothetical protein
MARLEAPLVVSANCLRSGGVRYLDTNGAWVRNIEAAQVFESLEDGAEVLASADDEAVVVAAALVAVRLEKGLPPVASHYREAIRANGPGAYACSKAPGARNVSL